MKFYFKQFDDIKVAKGMVPDVIEKKQIFKGSQASRAQLFFT